MKNKPRSENREWIYCPICGGKTRNKIWNDIQRTMQKTGETESLRVIPKGFTRVNGLCWFFLVFLIGSFAGWIYEEAFYWITEGILRNRGLLYGPWLPIYGIGTLGICLLKPLKRHPVLLFLSCILVTGIVEYTIGFAGIHLFNLRLWDYRGLFLNICGIICFRSVVSFGVMGLAFIFLLEPALEQIVRKVRSNILFAVCIFVLIFFLIDCYLSALFRTPITY